MTRRLLYLSLEAPSEGQAAYTHVVEIISGLRRQGWTVQLFAPSYAGTSKPQPGLLGKLSEFTRTQARLWRFRQPGDVIYVRSHFLAAPIALLAYLTRVPIVHEVNGPYEDLFISHGWTRNLAGILSSIQRWQYRVADTLIAVTPHLRQWLLDQLPGKSIHVIPNGANTGMFHPEATTERVLPERFVVFFGGFARWQGIETMLAAVDLPEWPTDVSLVIVGDGQQRDIVAEAAGRQRRLVWLGRLPYNEVPGIVCRAIASLVPKNRQGNREETGLFPLKIFETIACGTPAIVTDFPGQADLVRESGCGIVIPPEDPEALAQAVAKLAADPEAARQLGARGPALIQSEHSWQRRAEQTDEVLLNVLNR